LTKNKKGNREAKKPKQTASEKERKQKKYEKRNETIE
jgi:hypothetical protein